MPKSPNLAPILIRGARQLLTMRGQTGPRRGPALHDLGVVPDGAVLIDPKYCIGCGFCIQACPYGCRFLSPVTKTAEKCTLCYHRITKGLTTACCEACPTGARQLVDLKDPKDPIHEFLKTHSVQVLKPQMATGAKLFYNDLDGSVR